MDGGLQTPNSHSILSNEIVQRREVLRLGGCLAAETEESCALSTGIGLVRGLGRKLDHNRTQANCASEYG